MKVVEQIQTSYMDDSTKIRVFLSYSREDKPLVKEIYFLLKMDGFEPWLDQENLKPGQDWKLEIDKAVAASHAVVVFISSSGVDRSGYLHKEIGMALDVAERSPEGVISTIPIQLGECEMPRRLSHLHWLRAPSDPQAIAGIYSELQTSLLWCARQLRILSDEQLACMPSKPMGSKGEGVRPLQCGQYLVRGQNPNGDKYYGIAKVEIVDRKYEMTARIGGRTMNYVGDYPTCDGLNYLSVPEPVVLRGEFEVTYSSQSWTGIYEGKWGAGGTEELIPASPMADEFAP